MIWFGTAGNSNSFYDMGYKSTSQVPEYIKNEVIERSGMECVETASLEESLPQLDILYMTRVQRERFFNEADYLRLKDTPVLYRKFLRSSGY